MRALHRAVLLAVLAGCSGGDEQASTEEGGCTPAPGTICTIAGIDRAGYGGDGGPASEATLYLPQDVTVGPEGALYLLDWNNHRIRRIATDGTIETVVGSGMLGDGPAGPALETKFNHPTGVVFASDGTMVIAAWHNSRIREVDLETGILTESCGTGGRAYAGDGGPAKDAVLDLPASVAFDAAGDLYVMDQANQVIRRIDPAGIITRFAGVCLVNECAEGEEPEMCPDSNKMVCNPAGDPDACTRPCQPAFGGDGGPADELRMAQPYGQQADPAGRMVFDAEGNLYFADTDNHRVRRIDGDGIVTTVAGTGSAGVAGDGGDATKAELNRPTDLAVGPDGTLYIADTFNHCVRALNDGVLTTAVGVCGERGFSGDGGSPNEAHLDRPYGLDVAPNGDLYVVDTYNHRVRLVAR